MEEVTKEPGHRSSVSMPSLDSTDDFPPGATPTENSDSVFVSTASGDNLTTSEISEDFPVSSAESLSVVSVENIQSVGDLSAEALIEEASTVPLIEDEATNSLVDENSSERLVEGASTEELIDAARTEALIDTESEDLHQEVLDESQVEEDPSIAIDQFIKKIADEQLSSKRIEERKEEEAQEQREDDKNLNSKEDEKDLTDNTNEEKTDESSAGIKENSSTDDVALESSSVEEQNITIEADKPHEPSSLENTLTEENTSSQEPENRSTKVDKPEPMEVDSNIDDAPTQKSDLEEKMAEKGAIVVEEEIEHMQMESIEEIQKEIDRIPPKKNVQKEESVKPLESNSQSDPIPKTNGNDDIMEDESIEQILSGNIEQPKVGQILKIALQQEPKTPTIEDSSEVAKDAVLIEKAQEEIRKLDVLVCGECHNSFYYLQDFADHKNGKCPQTSSLTGPCESESKPQVWGFVLWKIKQTKDLRDKIPSSWSIYQRWCKLPQADKNAWITAGQSIQFASKIGNAKVTEVRPAKPAKQTTVQKISDASPPPIEFVDSNKENASRMDLENSATNIIRRGFTKPVRLNNDVTILPSSKNASTNSELLTNSNTAVRTTKVVSMQKDEYVVEKIMAKRFNPRKKTWEYNIKWENFGHDSNTWEPINNLSHCKKLLEQFEEQLKRMKEEKARQAAQSPKGRGRPSNPKPVRTSSTNFVPIAPKSIATISNVVGGVSDDYAGGSSNRPQRSSKQKAMNQVKQWCGNISDDDGSAGSGLKRRYETDDSDDDYFDDKKIKLEDDSDYSDTDVKPKISIKKVPVTTSKQTPTKTISVKNGNTTQQVLPSNILIPDANGVVRINQKQLPALSSGVYIMSKTAGIIKLDSTTSKVATSGGQTIVKVAPKIGQTQIKIVKKDGNTTKQIIQVTPKMPSLSTPIRIAPANKTNTPKFTPKIRREVKKPPPLIETASKFVPKKIEVAPPKKASLDSDSDDGLEPLPFPKPDEPIPDLDEKEDEFVLDPETGKIAGVQYVDKPVVIKEEPQPEPPSNELENIVKMAAADLSDEDFQNSDSQDEPSFTERKEVKAPSFTARKEVKATIKPVQKTVEVPTPTPAVRKVVKYSVGGQSVRADSSILNKTMGQVPQRQTISPAVIAAVPQQRRVVQQKVINQMVTQRTPGRTVVRHVIEPSRPGQGGNINVIRKTVTSTPKTKFNMSPQKQLPSPLQPTRTYSAMGGIRQATTAGMGSKVHVYSAKSNVSASQTTPQVQGGIRRIGNTVVRSTSSSQAPKPRQQYVQQHTTQKQPVTRIVQRVVTSPKKAVAQPVMNTSASKVQVKPAPPVKPKSVINMPSLTEDDAPITPPKLNPKPQTSSQPALQKVAPKLATPVKQEPVLKVEVPVVEESALQAEGVDSGAGMDQTDWSSFTMADGDNPIYVTGDDGTIYQVAGQNEQGQTILITQGADGQQQCLLVTNEIGEMAPDDPQPSTSTANTNAEGKTVETENVAAVEAQESELAAPTTIATPVDESIQTPLHIKTDTSEMEGIEDGVQDQVVAQVVRAEPPSPGGTHKVVVMLPDGNLMVTQVSPEEYASLELE